MLFLPAEFSKFVFGLEVMQGQILWHFRYACCKSIHVTSGGHGHDWKDSVIVYRYNRDFAWGFGDRNTSNGKCKIKASLCGLGLSLRIIYVCYPAAMTLT